MKFMRAKIHHLYLSGTYKNDNIYFNYDKDEHEPVTVYLNFNTPREEGIWKSGSAASGIIQDDQMTCSSSGP